MEKNKQSKLIESDLRFVHQLFRFDGVVQRFEQIFGEIAAVVQLVQIVAELLKRHFAGDFLGRRVRDVLQRIHRTKSFSLFEHCLLFTPIH